MVPRTIVVLVIASSAVPRASASPRSDPTTGRAVFSGATLPTPTSIGLNPAALGTTRIDREATFAVSGVLEHLAVDRREIDPDTGELVDSDRRIRDVELGAGGMLAFVWRAGSSVTLGANARRTLPELAPRDPDAKYFSRGSQQSNYIVNFAASLRLSSQFYFGFGIEHDVTRLRLRYARDTALDAGRGDCALPDGTLTSCGFENPAARELYDIDVRSKLLSIENLKLNIGVLARVYRQTWIGIAYHNTPGFGIQTQLDGDMTVRRSPRDGSALLEGSSTVYVSYPASVDAEVRSRILPQLDLHVGGRWEDLSRMQAYDVRGYGVGFRGQNVPEWQLRPRGFFDSVAMWAGVEQVDLGERVRAGGRLGFETSAGPPDRTAPGTVVPTSATVDLGVQLRIAPSWIVRATYGVQYFPQVSVTDSEYDPRLAIDCANSGFDYSTRACEALRNGYAIPTAAGDYTRFQHAVRIAFSYELP